eukprot:31565-Pelagococcus_subviridis.AAC.13
MTDTRHPRSSRASASVGRVAALAARRQSISPRRGTRRAMLTMSVAATTTTTIAKASPARGLAARSTAATTTTGGLGLGRRRRSSDAARRRRRGVARRVGVVVLAAASKGDDRPVLHVQPVAGARARVVATGSRARIAIPVRPSSFIRSIERTNERTNAAHPPVAPPHPISSSPQYLGDLGCEHVVYKNDEKTVAEIAAMNPKGVMVSPGPGRPEDSGISLEACEKLGAKTSSDCFPYIRPGSLVARRSLRWRAGLAAPAAARFDTCARVPPMRTPRR